MRYGLTCARAQRWGKISRFKGIDHAKMTILSSFRLLTHAVCFLYNELYRRLGLKMTKMHHKSGLYNLCAIFYIFLKP